MMTDLRWPLWLAPIEWPLRVLIWPPLKWVVRALENDDNGSPRLSWSKVVTVIVLFLAWVTGTFGLGIALIAVAASFGRDTFRLFLKTRAVTATATTETKINAADVIKAIQERRHPDSGIEETP